MSIYLARNLCIAVLALSAFSPETAIANWQYTTWGQLPAELTAASKGAAAPNLDRGRDPGSYRAELKADYVGQGFEFVVYFVFDEAEKLIYVDLDPKHPTKCNDIRFALLNSKAVQTGRLLNSYGKPDKTGSFGLLKWWHRDSGNVVIYSVLGHCQIRYMAYTAPSSAGGL